MKNFIIALLFFANTNFFSQEIRCIYELKYKTDSTSIDYRDKIMYLDGTNDSKRFYSYNLFKSDSISNFERTPLSKSFDYSFYVYEKDSVISKIFRIFYDLYELKEKKEKLNWILTDETRRIGTLNCQKATLEYKGRTWYAWFSNELSTSLGPYVFDGLPGVTVSLYDSKENYIFNLLEYKSTFYDPYEKVYNIGLKTILVTQNQLKKIYIDYYNDPYKEVKSGKMLINFKDQDGNKITPNFNQLTLIKQQEIKSENNPIELSEVIIYPN